MAIHRVNIMRKRKRINSPHLQLDVTGALPHPRPKPLSDVDSRPHKTAQWASKCIVIVNRQHEVQSSIHSYFDSSDIDKNARHSKRSFATISILHGCCRPFVNDRMYCQNGDESPRSISKEPPSLSTSAGIGICKVFRESEMLGNRKMSELLGPTTWISKFHGPFPLQKQGE